MGYAFRSAAFSDNEYDIKLLRGENIAQGTAKWSNTKYWPRDIAVEDKYALTAGDVVLAMDRPWIDAGLKFATIRERDLPAFLVQRVALMRARAGTDQGYVSCIVSSPEFTNYILGAQTGTSIPHISGNQISRYRLTPHSLPEQKAIAEVLGALDDKIAANTKLVQTSDELAGVLTRRALDFENRVPLSSVAQVTMGSSPPGVTLNEVGAGEVFYQGVRDFGVRFPVNRVWTTGPVRFAEKLDTLLSVRAPVGRANLAQERTCIGRGIASIRSIEAHPYSIFHRLRDDPEMWAPYEAEGTVFGSINRGQLDKLAMPAILADDSDRLEAQLAAIELRVASALAENRTLAATRDALLPQLMSGKLRVRGAEKAVEAVV